MKKILLLIILVTGQNLFAAILSNGQPQNLGMCTDSSTGCFDLTVNNDNVLTGLDPADYSISYHETQADATAGTNAISNATSYCIAPGTETIYLRRQANAGGAFETFDFSVSVHTAFGGALVLSQMVQCDDDNDGFVIFNLVAGAYLIDDNILTFYPTVADAQAQTNEITNPTAYSIAAGVNSDTTIIVRQQIDGDCDILTQLPIIALPNCSVGNMCQTANSLCSALGVPFSNTINIEEAQPFYYACLADTPNPVWFYITISSPGDLHLKIEQSSSINFVNNNLDADYIIFGPFTDPVTPCSNGTLMGNNIDSCSNSIANIEYPTVENVQPGEFYLMMVTNYSNQPGYIRITEMPTSTAGIDCTGITMNAFLDANSNGTMDDGEQPFPLGQFSYQVNNEGIVHNAIASSGSYNIYDSTGTNTYDLNFTIDPEYAAFYALTTASFNDVSVNAGAGMVAYNFPVTALQSYSDVSVVIIPLAAPMPGFEYVSKIIYSNLGSAVVPAGTITFTKDPVTGIISISEPSAVTTPTGFTFDYVSLQPFEVREMTVTLQIPTIPTVQLGQSITNSASITPLVGDVVAVNNVYITSEKIIGSYDPNDKMESHGGEILFSTFGAEDHLYYTIRFENTGTAPAINIRVEDFLDESLDVASLRMVSASHEYTMDRIDNQVVWQFNNILLPFTGADPVGSHGYITFKIKPAAGYEVGDIIPNTASIFFDFNPAIITNTFTTEFVAALAVTDLQQIQYSISPNPAADIVSISVTDSTESLSVKLFDMIGKQIMSHEMTGNGIYNLDVSGVNSGIYLIEISAAGKSKSVKKLVIK